MKPYPKCVDCRRFMRNGKEKAADHPGTIAAGAQGMCITCYQNERLPKRPRKHYHVRIQPMGTRHDPTRLEDLIVFPAVTTPGRYPAECVYGDCKWRDYAHSDLAIRAKAYVHAEVHLEPLESE